jgi:hypothetical protein
MQKRLYPQNRDAGARSFFTAPVNSRTGFDHTSRRGKPGQSAAMQIKVIPEKTAVGCFEAFNYQEICVY